MSKYIILDIVFYANSLNYDQGVGNYQELKKVTKWDGKQYILVSRYALRYSILHTANKLYPEDWILASGNELIKDAKKGVARPKLGLVERNNQKERVEGKDILSYPEFDLFGFMIAKSKEKRESEEKRYTRVSPVKISHAISLTPFTFDSHFMANLDIMRRAGGEGSNPVNIEEKKDFYIYNVIIDVDRIGIYTKEESGLNETIFIDEDKEKNEQKKYERIIQLIETIFNLKREIKGRLEDLSPWLLIIGLYNNGRYETFMDRIELTKSHTYKVVTKEKRYRDDEGREIIEVENNTIEKDAPRFIIDIDQFMYKSEEDIICNIKRFLKEQSIDSNIMIFKRPFIEVTTNNDKNG